MHQRRVRREKKKSDENPSDKAARRTANATAWIAIFTIVLAGVGYLQFTEILDSGAESTGQMDQMVHEYRSQVAQLKRQAGDTHDLAVQAKNQADRTKDMADRMKDQADRTKTIADQAIIQAKAAKSAAETADKALHISERAYVVAATPSMNVASNLVTLPIVNTGHIPSGAVKAVIHEATLVITPGSPTNSSIETHWKNYTLESVPTNGETLSFNIATPNADAAQLKSGNQQVLIVGTISYNDGFRDDPDQQWSFCFGDAVTPQNKDLGWVVCDSALYLSQAIATDHYPQNEYTK
jgi:hypothetical protein